MKILFVSSGNSGTVKILVKNQALALSSQGIEVSHFLIKGKGLWGYIKNITKLRKEALSGDYAIVHAHYSYSAFVATIAGCKSLVVSLMGSDAFTNRPVRYLIRLCSLYFWKTTIVKTAEMKALLRMPHAVVLPNGVDTKAFSPMDKLAARRYLKIQGEKKIILFLSDPARPEKNYRLAEMAVKKLAHNDVELLTVYNLPHNVIPYYLNACDVLLITSSYEGGVNVVKEAMACNVPIVSTDVGDVRKNTAGVSGAYICDRGPEELSQGLAKALIQEKSINGREKLIELGLDAKSVAIKMIQIYERIR